MVLNRAFRRTTLALSAILLLFLYCTVLAQQAQKPDQKHSLWKVQSKTNTVYLLGSIHALRQNAYPLDAAVEQAYEKSAQLFFEMNLDEAESPKLQQLSVFRGTYHNGRSLKDDLSNQTYELVKKHLPDLGLRIEQVERFKPWLLAMTLEMSELQQMGFDPDRGIDRYFYEKAKNDRKETHGFETGAYQLNLLSDMPAGMQEAMLLETMQDINSALKDMDVIVEAWRTGNTGELEQFLLKGFRDFPDVYQRLIVVRNKNWTPRIETLIGQKENVLVVVGAAHLVGKDGILAALKRDGYQVEQL